jgi:hypothetical protein
VKPTLPLVIEDPNAVAGNSTIQPTNLVLLGGEGQ